MGIQTVGGTLALALLCCVGEAIGQDATPDDEAQRKQTRAQMEQRWQQLRAYRLIDGQEVEAERVANPVLIFSEATRDTGHLGTLWVWGKQGRPVALFAIGKAYNMPLWGFELAALREDVSVTMPDGWKWQPKSSLTMKPFPTGPSPARTSTGRLLQMKSLARQFVVSEYYFEEETQLRMMPRQVYRYDEADAGLVDGAIFNFAHGTNPEALALIECHTQANVTRWSYGFVPMAGAAVTAKLNDQIVWEKEPTQETRAQAMYSTWLEEE